jgi:aryl carrier-like protein
MAYWLKKASFRQVILGKIQDEPGAVEAEQVNFQGLFAAASSLEEAGKAVTEALVKKLAKTLSLTQEELDPNKPMHSYGVDSLVAVELRNWFSKEPRADVAIFDILGGATISTVAVMAAAKSKYRKSEWTY